MSGRIVEVAVHENQQVGAGDLLFRLDPAPFEVAVRQADAAIASARLQVEQLWAAYQESLASRRAAKQEVEYRQHDFDRQQALTRNGCAAQSRYDEALNELRAALGGDPDVATDRHPQVAEALARRDKAALDLEHATVRAPADGIVSQTGRLLVGQCIPSGT
ncbi:HlyD family secretion protein [Arenibaculum pallidiluteum]|uniref:HlyD family secretion protein n=1 Tax=Arenibaculum pallidiluteum TaxID=2812559 RepID=UPI001A969E7D|nr:biotin/lipoyl-binding protein [Arenibaculum pallidiluteum]